MRAVQRNEQFGIARVRREQLEHPAPDRLHVGRDAEVTIATDDARRAVTLEDRNKIRIGLAEHEGATLFHDAGLLARDQL